MRIRLAVPDELDDQDRKAALEHALEAVTIANVPGIRAGKIPTAKEAIAAGGQWRPEPPGDEHFDLAQTVVRRGHGDCDDWAPYHSASLRATGVDPGARAIVRKSGPMRWHAVTQRSDGSIEDPSKAAGMGKNGHAVSGPGGVHVVGAYAPITPPISSDGRLCIAIAPSKDPTRPAIWYARCDVPDRFESWDWSSNAKNTHPAKALLRALDGCSAVSGGAMDPTDEARLHAVRGLILGASPDEVASTIHALMGHMVNADHVVGEAVQSVGFFKNLLKAVASPITSTAKFVRHPSLKNFGQVFTSPLKAVATAAKPFAGAIRFIPGIGPVAASAVDLINNPPKNWKDAGKFVARQAAGFVPGVGPLLAQGLPGLPGFAAPLATALQAGAGQQAEASFGLPNMVYEAGTVARPWSVSGPAVLRF